MNEEAEIEETNTIIMQTRLDEDVRLSKKEDGTGRRTGRKAARRLCSGRFESSARLDSSEGRVS